MGNEKSSNAMKIPETGQWSTEAQNKIRDKVKGDIQQYAADVMKNSDPANVIWNVQEGQTLGAIAFAFDKAYKNLGKNLKINWGTTVEFTRDGKTQTVKLAQVNPKDFTIFAGDKVQLKEVDGKWVIMVNGGGAATAPEAGEYGPDVNQVDAVGTDVNEADAGSNNGADVDQSDAVGGDVHQTDAVGKDVQQN